MRLLPFTALLVGCGDGDWIVTTWGEDYIEEGIPAEEFEDRCSATFDTFEVELTEAALLDGNGEVAGSVSVARFDMTTPGPQEVGVATVPATLYDRAQFGISSADGSSVHAVGDVTCGADTVRFDWSFETDTTYLCEPDELRVPAGGEATTQLTIHGDHFFYDALEGDDAVLRGQALVDADTDADGVVTLTELEAVELAGLGYSVGPYSEVTDLAAFITFLTRTLGHVDGEGHCQVDL